MLHRVGYNQAAAFLVNYKNNHYFYQSFFLYFLIIIIR